MKNRGSGVIDITRNPGVLESFHIPNQDRKYLEKLLRNRLRYSNELLNRLNYGKFRLEFREDWTNEITGSVAVPFLLGKREDDICAKWQFDAVERIAQRTFERKPSITDFYCYGATKVGKTRVSLASCIMLAALHEMIKYPQKTMMQFVLLPDTKHEDQYTSKDFPIVRYLFDKLVLVHGNKRVNINEMIDRWEREARNNGGTLFLRRTGSKASEQFFAMQTAMAQAGNRKLFIMLDEADKGAGRNSCQVRWFNNVPVNGQSYKPVHAQGENPFALTYHWTATGNHLDLCADKCEKIDIGASPTYQSIKDLPLWDIETTMENLNMPELFMIGTGVMPTNNPALDLKAYLLHFYPEDFGKRNKHNELVYYPNGRVKPDKDMVNAAILSGGFDDEWKEYKSEIPKIFRKLFSELTKKNPNVMWSHYRSNYEQMALVEEIRVYAKDFLILPFFDIYDPRYGVNFFKQYGTATEAIKKIRKLTNSDLPVVVNGTAGFDRSNEFPRGILADTGSYAYTTEATYVQKAGRNTGSAEAQSINSGEHFFVIFGPVASEQSHTYKESGACKDTPKSIHTMPAERMRSGIKVELFRRDVDNTDKFPIIKKAWEDTREYYLNKQCMLDKVLTHKGGDKGRLMGGGVLLTRLFKQGQLDKDLFDIWNPALDWIQKNHKLVLVNSMGQPRFTETPVFQRLLNVAGLDAQQAGHFRTSDFNGKTTQAKPGKKLEAEEFAAYIKPYLDTDMVQEVMGVNVHCGKVYAQIGFRWTEDDNSLAARYSNSRNLQIQLFYRVDMSNVLLPMVPVSIGFRLKNNPLEAVNLDRPKNGTVGANLMSEEERKKYGVNV